MNDYVEIAKLAINTLLMLGLIYCWRLYRIDALRQRLFAVRDELFAYAASGAIALDDPAYRQLREMMNGMIRFAYRITFLRLWMSIVLLRLRPQANVEVRSPYVVWRKRVDHVHSREVRAQLFRFHDRMIVLVASHLVTGSPILLGMLAVFMVRLALKGAYQRVLESFALSSMRPGITLIEAQAVASNRQAAAA